VIGICCIGITFGTGCPGHAGPGIDAESMIGGIEWTPLKPLWQLHSPGIAPAGALLERNKRGNHRLSSQDDVDIHPEAMNNKPLARASEAKRRRSMGITSSVDRLIRPRASRPGIKIMRPVRFLSKSPNLLSRTFSRRPYTQQRS
jgi:hypothetical protein